MRSLKLVGSIWMIAAGFSAWAAGEADRVTFQGEPPVSCLGEQACPAPSPESVLRGSEAANEMLAQLAAMPEQERRYFLDTLPGHRGFAIFPNVQKRGFFGAVLYGRGIMSYRDEWGDWSSPIMLTLQGESLGPQFGLQSSNYIFLFKSICGVKDFLSGHHHLSSSGLGVTVEHVGDTGPSEPLNITMHVFEHGFMLGQSFDRYAIHIDEDVNAALYGVALKPGCIVEGVRYGLQRPWVQRYLERLGLPADRPHEMFELLNQAPPANATSR